MEDALRPRAVFGSILRREHALQRKVPGWKRPMAESHPIKGSCSLGRAGANTNCRGIAESFAPPRTDSSAKHWRTLVDRFRQQQRHFFEQAAH